MPTWQASISQWDVHLERRSAHTLKRGIDCTHLCEPSGVLESWTDTLLVALEERAKARTSIRPSASGLPPIHRLSRDLDSA